MIISGVSTLTEVQVVFLWFCWLWWVWRIGHVPLLNVGHLNSSVAEYVACEPSTAAYSATALKIVAGTDVEAQTGIPIAGWLRWIWHVPSLDLDHLNPWQLQHSHSRPLG